MGRASERLAGKPASAVFHYDLQARYPVAVSGDRCWITDDAGNRWLDAGGGAGAVTIGYGIGEIVDAIAAQAASQAFAYSRAFTTRAQEDLAAEVVAMAVGHGGLAYFVSGGSEANESAVKIARLYHLERGEPSKYKVISRWPSYHGNTLATLTLSGRPSWSSPFAPLLQAGRYVPAPYRLHAGFDMSPEEYGAWCAARLEEMILREGADSVSALIAEPIIGGTAPAVMPPANYWPLVRSICDKYDVLLIIDEVLTGFGRTGRNFAIEHFGITPDLLTCAKGLTSGYAPLGAVVAAARVAEVFRAGSGRLRHSFTYSGHPVGCAAGLAAVRYLTAHDLSARASELGDTLLKGLSARLEGKDTIAEIRGIGLLIGVEFQFPDGPESTEANIRFSERVAAIARRERVILTPATNGDQLQLIPPILTEPAELEMLIDVVGRAVEIAERQG